MTESSFESLSIDKRILKALYEEGYTQPTPIQRDSIPTGIEGGDVLAIAPTGTGKTAAFTIPILQRLSKGRGLRALILTPTRELALQIHESLRAYGRHLSLRHATIMGGVSQHQQVQDLKRGVDILVATPGRLLDLMEQGHVKLGGVEVLVLDEADRMLDMGFIHDVKRIVKTVPAKRQTLFFSATMPKAVTELANSLLRNPIRVQVNQAPISERRIEQKAVFVEHAAKIGLLTRLLRDPDARSVLVFTRTKHKADRVVTQLTRAGIEVGAIHSEQDPGCARQRVLAGVSPTATCGCWWPPTSSREASTLRASPTSSTTTSRTTRKTTSTASAAPRAPGAAGHRHLVLQPGRAVQAQRPSSASHARRSKPSPPAPSSRTSPNRPLPHPARPRSRAARKTAKASPIGPAAAASPAASSSRRTARRPSAAHAVAAIAKDRRRAPAPDQRHQDKPPGGNHPARLAFNAAALRVT
jgi:hypothetical protein